MYRSVEVTKKLYVDCFSIPESKIKLGIELINNKTLGMYLIFISLFKYQVSLQYFRGL